MSKPDTSKSNNTSSIPKKSSAFSLLKSSVSVGSMTMLSRVLGLIRDVVFANLIGAGAAADAFYVAFKIPNFFRRLFAEGAFNQAFVPVLADYRKNLPHEQVRYFVSRVSGTLGVILVFFAFLIVLFPQILSAPFALGYLLGSDADDPLKFDYASEMLRITFPYLMLISLTGISASILNTYDRFAAPAFTPVLLNLSLIGAAIYVSPRMDVPAFALAWGVLVAGVIQLLFQMPFLARIHMLPAPVWGWSDPGVKRVVALMIPAIFGVSVSQINLLLDTQLAVFLPTGSVSWLYYSDRLSELPLGVFGIAIATVILPSLSRQHLSSDPEKFSGMIDWAIRMVMLIGLPAAVALLLLAEPILATLFQSEVFRDNDVMMAAWSLRAYALGLLAFMLIKVLAPGYFSREDMKTPVRIGIIALVANMALNLMLVLWLHFSYQLGHMGLALATTLSAFLNAGLLARGLVHSGYYAPCVGWAVFVGRLLVGLLCLAAVVGYFLSIWQGWLDWNRWEKIWRLAIICSAGASVYFVGLFLAGMRPADLRH